jgi:hypothetical protein
MLNTTTTVLAPQFSLGDEDELTALLEVGGLCRVTIVARNYTVRQPQIHN